MKKVIIGHKNIALPNLLCSCNSPPNISITTTYKIVFNTNAKKAKGTGKKYFVIFLKEVILF